MEVTGFISIWVKNLANVANTVGWVRGERTGAQTIPRVCVCVCWLVGRSVRFGQPDPTQPTLFGL